MLNLLSIENESKNGFLSNLNDKIHNQPNEILKHTKKEYANAIVEQN